MIIEIMIKVEVEVKLVGEGWEDLNKNLILEELKCVCKNLFGVGNFIF